MIYLINICHRRFLGVWVTEFAAGGQVDDNIRVLVAEVGSGRQVGFGVGATEALGQRAKDLQRGIEAGVRVVRESLSGAVAVQGWHRREVAVTFGITLTAESGVVVARASAEASFEVKVTYRSDDA
jgi:hypothetical protein